MPEITSVTIRYRFELEDFNVSVSETYKPKRKSKPKRKPKREPEKETPEPKQRFER